MGDFESKEITKELDYKKTPLWEEGLSLDERLDFLVKELTLEEKIRCVCTKAPEIKRLGITSFALGGEAAHGVEARHDQSFNQGTPIQTTVFTQPIGMSSTWDTEVIEKAGTVVGTEARAVFKQEGDRGLLRWAPTVDMERNSIQRNILTLLYNYITINVKYYNYIVMNERNELMLSKPAMLLLGMIYESPHGAYEITKKLELMNVKWWLPVPDATVYSTIRTLEKNEFIVGKSEKNGNMPERTVYTITEKGKEALLNSMRSTFSKMDYDTTIFSITASYIEYLPKDEVRELIKLRLDMLSEYKKGIQENIAKISRLDLSNLTLSGIERMIDIVEAEIISANRMLHSMKEGGKSED